MSADGDLNRCTVAVAKRLVAKLEELLADDWTDTGEVVELLEEARSELVEAEKFRNLWIWGS